MTPSNPIPVQAGGPDVSASSGHVQKTTPVPQCIGGFSLVERQVRKIGGIKCFEELQGYEDAAKARGILPEELSAIHKKRIALTPKKRRAKR